MRFREGFAACLLVLVGVAIGATQSRPTAAQAQRPAPAGQIGRYQMMVCSGQTPYAVITDSATGQTWTLDASSPVRSWSDFGVPPKQ